jgi:nitrate reductase delta subunit
MTELSMFAEAFSYPVPGRLENWMAGLSALPESPGQTEYAAFLQALQPLSQGELEELHTRTLDLNPEFAPYLGYQIWGDSYKRGSLMSRLNKVMQENQIDLGGELPDHLMPVLRYLGQAKDPVPDLIQIFEPALEKMIQKLKKQDPDNPYRHLLQAVLYTSNRK